MATISRRDFVRTAFAGMPLYAALAGKIDSIVNGVRLGTITYSFRDLPRTPGASDAVDVMIHALTDCGIGEIELFSPHVEPPLRAREELRRWGIFPPLYHFPAVLQRGEQPRSTRFSFTLNF